MADSEDLLQSNDLRSIRAEVAAEAAGAAPVEVAGPAAAPPEPPEAPPLIAGQDVAVQLDFLREAVEVLEVPDPIGPAFALAADDGREVAGAAASWRAIAEALRPAASVVESEAAAVESAWDGRDSDAFADRLREVGARGAELAAAVADLAESLEAAAGELRGLAREMRELIAGVAEPVCAALQRSEPDLAAAREHLMRARRPAAGLAESAEEVLAGVARRCADLEQRLPPAPAAIPAPASGTPLRTELVAGGPAQVTTAQAEQEPDSEESSATSTGAAVVGGGMAGGMLPMAGMAAMGRAGGSARDRRKKPRAGASTDDLFGAPAPAVDPVLGDAGKKSEGSGKPGEAKDQRS
ncbi:WXG100 family type VII secretion target [Saccharopolyspora sp. MS10]|uniref:WXG100 family type VII secretion target n=1 Tax=Saccharopolyspora sp. MS10 TaxID=3385973 RepID=UPI0039A3B44D